jgi:hypothetical protein
MALFATDDGARTGSVEAERRRSVDNMVMKMATFILRRCCGDGVSRFQRADLMPSIRAWDGKSTAPWILYYVYEFAISCPTSKPNLGLN